MIDLMLDPKPLRHNLEKKHPGAKRLPLAVRDELVVLSGADPTVYARLYAMVETVRSASWSEGYREGEQDEAEAADVAGG